MDIICHKCHVPTDETDIHWSDDKLYQCIHCYQETKFGKVMINDIPVEETI